MAVDRLLPVLKSFDIVGVKAVERYPKGRLSYAKSPFYASTGSTRAFTAMGAGEHLRATTRASGCPLLKDEHHHHACHLKRARSKRNCPALACHTRYDSAIAGRKEQLLAQAAHKWW